MAITKYDQFDFLIDIVPRDDIKTTKVRDDTRTSSSDQVHNLHFVFVLINLTLQFPFLGPILFSISTAT